MSADFRHLARGDDFAHRIENRRHDFSGSPGVEAQCARKLFADRLPRHRTVRSVYALIELRPQFRGQLRNEMLGLALRQAPAQHAHSQQQRPLAPHTIQAGSALGVVVRGETAHFDYICNAASTGLARGGLDTGVPCAFGVLTTETHAQAEARSGGAVGNAGADAADAAIAMVNLLREVH